MSFGDRKRSIGAPKETVRTAMKFTPIYENDQEILRESPQSLILTIAAMRRSRFLLSGRSALSRPGRTIRRNGRGAAAQGRVAAPGLDAASSAVVSTRSSVIDAWMPRAAA
jgi:hypothetical protein